MSFQIPRSLVQRSCCSDGGKSKETKNKEANRRNHLHLQKLSKLLDCPVCWKISEHETLIRCRNGHFGCKSCIAGLKFCPDCRINLEPEIPTFSHETLLTINKELRHLETQSALLSHKGIANVFKWIICKHTPTLLPVLHCKVSHIYCYRCTKRSKWCLGHF